MLDEFVVLSCEPIENRWGPCLVVHWKILDSSERLKPGLVERKYLRNKTKARFEELGLDSPGMIGRVQRTPGHAPFGRPCEFLEFYFRPC